MRALTAIAALALAAGALTATPASASAAAPAVATSAVAPSAVGATGTLVYIKAHNVWISTADGRRHHRVTTDGTAGSPYSAPSMSDAGIVAVSKGYSIVRMRQNGVVLNRIDPPPLPGSAGSPVDGVPDSVISPDGSKIAWSVSAYQCPVGVSCGIRSATGYTAAGRYQSAGRSTYFRNPSWVSSTRTLQGGGYGSHVMLHDLTTTPKLWFNDGDVFASSTDLGDSELSRDGKYLAAVRGYGDSTQIAWYAVRGNARTGTPPAPPTALCNTNEAAGFAGPTFSPDSQGLAWEEPDGIWVKRGLSSCDTPQPSLLIAGGSEPHWSPASLNPPAVAKPAPPKTKTFVVKKKPRVKGKAKVGKKVSVTAGTWSPRPTKLTYRWYRGAKAIKGKAGAKRTLKVTRADRGKRLRVKVTVKRSGYKAKSVWSTRTAKVKR